MSEYKYEKKEVWYKLDAVGSAYRSTGVQEYTGVQ